MLVPEFLAHELGAPILLASTVFVIAHEAGDYEGHFV